MLQKTWEFGRGGGIRTLDILLPKQARYRAAPHPERRRILINFALGSQTDLREIIANPHLTNINKTQLAVGGRFRYKVPLRTKRTY